jgi:hypothetical protein
MIDDDSMRQICTIRSNPISLPVESDHLAGPFRSLCRWKAITLPVHSDQPAG